MEKLAILLLLVSSLLIINHPEKSIASPQLSSYLRQEDQCGQYEASAESCRNAGCHFSCHDRRCTSTEVSCTEECYKYCYDPCSCAKAGCLYNFKDFSCSRKVKECRNLLNLTDCIRKGSYYAVNGHLCRSSTEIGDCQKENLYSRGVNFAGGRVTDSHGIEYEFTGPDASYPSLFSSFFKLTDVDGVPPGDQAIYTKGEKGTNRTTNGGCIGLITIVPEEAYGYWEATMKTVEYWPANSGQRIFTILLNGVKVVPLFNIQTYVPAVTYGMELIIRFVMYRDSEQPEGWMLKIEGHEPVHVTQGNFEFTVCPDETCGVGYGIVSGMAVIHLNSNPIPPDQL